MFAGMQLAGRAFGDRLHLWAGSVRLVRSGAAVAVVGLIIELLPEPVPVSIAGLAVYSPGLSVLVPIVFGAVGHGSAAVAAGRHGHGRGHNRAGGGVWPVVLFTRVPGGPYAGCS